MNFHPGTLMMMHLDGLFNIRNGFGQNSNFLFLANFFSCAFYGSIMIKLSSFLTWVFIASLWMACNLTCWCILTTFTTDLILVIFCWCSWIWQHFDLVKQVRFGVFPVFKISAWSWTLTGKTWVGPTSFPSLPYINFIKFLLWSGKYQILFWRLFSRIFFRRVTIQYWAAFSCAELRVQPNAKLSW